MRNIIHLNEAISKTIITIFKHGQRNILTMCVSKWRL